jgi:hypothetical protein
MPEPDERTPGTTEEPTETTVDTTADGSGSEADGSESAAPSREDEIADLRRKNEQLLSEKTRYEATQRENEELRRRATSPHPPATGDDNDNAQRYREDLRLEREIFNGVQPSLDHFQAKARLDLHRHNVAMAATRKTDQRVEAAKLPEDLRDEAEKLAEEEGISVKLAARLLKAERAATGKTEAVQTEDERLARLRAKREATPATRSTAVTADRAGSLTRTEYNRRLDKFREEDDMRGAAEFIKKNRDSVR